MAKARLSKAQKAFREASDLVKEKSLDLRTAERLEKTAKKRLTDLMIALNPYLKLSKKQEAELKAVGDARSAAHDRVVAARKEWLAAIDKMIHTGEKVIPRRKRA